MDVTLLFVEVYLLADVECLMLVIVRGHLAAVSVLCTKHELWINQVYHYGSGCTGIMVPCHRLPLAVPFEWEIL